LHQLARLESLQTRRKDVARRYDEVFEEVAEITQPVTRPGAESARHLYPIRLDLDALTIDRAEFIEQLATRNIASSVHFIPVHVHPYYRDKYGFVNDQFPVAWAEYQRLVSLPLYPRMSDADADDVIEAVLDVIAAHRR
jgi:dTDP-4-amino-4,6-dideoxygalactose transaminase